jgi:hypothetical protein
MKRHQHFQSFQKQPARKRTAYDWTIIFVLLALFFGVMIIGVVNC